MKSKSLLIVSLSIVLTAAVILLYVFMPKSQENISWFENYKSESMEPYGGYVIAGLMKDYFPGEKFYMMDEPLARSEMTEHKEGHGNYILIGIAMKQREKDIDTLLDFVSQGNQAFISTRVAPELLLGKIYEDDCGTVYEYGTLSDSVKHLGFYHSSLSSDTTYRFDYFFNSSWTGTLRQYDWKYISGQYFCDSSYTILTRLGYIYQVADTGYVNFMKVPYGKGEFYFHTIPLAFTNYSLKSKAALEYCGKVFSHLEPGKIYWDQYSRTGAYDNEENGQVSLGPFNYILSQESLRWSFYVLMALVILYIFIQSKRKQKAIPVLEANDNTSLEFIQTIGLLYHQNHDHKKICMMKMKQFLAFIRDRYFISTSSIDTELVMKISLKSQLPHDFINDLFRTAKQFENTVIEISDQELAQFHTSLENFYKKCK